MFVSWSPALAAATRTGFSADSGR
ncbi:hypothetical protein A2U01_0093667, partial [Trifolium medium]|nr:hypothetical protein [Trifolium medium]